MKLSHTYRAMLLILLSTGTVTRATPSDEPVPEQEAPAAPPTSEAAQKRDPFWPVGYTPIAERPEPINEELARVQEQTHWPELELTGHSRTGKNTYMAIIKGIGIVDSGDIVSMEKDGLVYSWRINAVTAKGISRTRLGVQEAKALHNPTK